MSAKSVAAHLGQIRIVRSCPTAGASVAPCEVSLAAFARLTGFASLAYGARGLLDTTLAIVALPSVSLDIARLVVAACSPRVATAQTRSAAQVHSRHRAHARDSEAAGPSTRQAPRRCSPRAPRRGCSACPTCAPRRRAPIAPGKRPHRHALCPATPEVFATT